MADIHQLEAKLRSLKLNGMLDTLNLRLGQAQKDNLGFIHFLEILLEDEGQHRTNKRLSSRITKAHFEEQKSLEEFDFTFNPKMPSQYIHDLATCQYPVYRKEGVYNPLWSCGCGKDSPCPGFRTPGLPAGIYRALLQSQPSSI